MGFQVINKYAISPCAEKQLSVELVDAFDVNCWKTAFNRENRYGMVELKVNRRKGIFNWIVDMHTMCRTDPNLPFRVAIDCSAFVAQQLIVATRARIILEIGSVKSIYTAVGRNPQKTLLVFCEVSNVSVF